MNQTATNPLLHRSRAFVYDPKGMERASLWADEHRKQGYHVTQAHNLGVGPTGHSIIRFVLEDRPAWLTPKSPLLLMAAGKQGYPVVLAGTNEGKLNHFR